MTANMPDHSTLLSDLEFVAFDLETTGLSPHECRIVEFGALRFRLDGTICESFEQLVDPECHIPHGVTRIHGITDAMVRGMPTVGETLPRFVEFLGHGESVALAHNASFDVGFINAALVIRNAPCLAVPVIDTVRLARRAIPGMYNYRLAGLAVGLQLADAEEHRALSDARLVQRLFCKIAAIRSELTTVGHLFRWSPPLRTAQENQTTPFHSFDHAHLLLAIEQQRTVVMVYEGGSKGLSDRRVTPRNLVNAYGTRCLVAFCHTDQMEKTFRLDRIRDLRIEND